MGTKRGGHIPSALHLDWRETIDQATKRFKPTSVIQEMFARTGLSPEVKRTKGPAVAKKIRRRQANSVSSGEQIQPVGIAKESR